MKSEKQIKAAATQKREEFTALLKEQQIDSQETRKRLGDRATKAAVLKGEIQALEGLLTVANKKEKK
jgi:hypothetical protein